MGGAGRHSRVPEGHRRRCRVGERTDLGPVDAEAIPEATEESRAAAVIIDATLDAVRAALDEAVDELGRLDAVAGDGDHGIGMQRGARAGRTAAATALAAGAGAGTLLTRAGDAWADRAGGTSGALWGVALRALGERLGDTERPSARSVADGAAAAGTGSSGTARPRSVTRRWWTR